MESKKGVSLKPSRAEGHVPLNLHIQANIKKQAKILALRRGVSLSSVVTDLLKVWLRND